MALDLVSALATVKDLDCHDFGHVFIKLVAICVHFKELKSSIQYGFTVALICAESTPKENI